jgi:4-amino-4-deoxy-L-arabinose transferase-like glycosyltransferase
MGKGADRTFALRLLLIAAAGLALRVLYTVVLDPHQTGIGDFYHYHDLANTIADGYGYVDPGSVLAGHAMPTAGHPPLWPELLSVVSRLGGSGAPVHSFGSHGYIAHRLTGGFVGTGTLIAIGYLGRRAAGPRVGLIAAGIGALYPVLIAADGSMMSETLFGFCVAISLLIAYRLLDNPNGWWALALGLAIGVSSLARSEGLLLLPILGIAAVWKNGTPGFVATRFVIVFVGFAIAIAPWTIRNTLRFDRLVIGSNNSGSVVAGANCHETYYGKYTGLWSLRCVGAQGPNEAEAAAEQRHRAIDYASGHLSRLPVVLSVRLLRTFDLYQPWSTVLLNEGRPATASRIGLVCYWMLLPLAIVGLIVLRQRGVMLRILLAPVFLVIVSTLMGWGLTRFRHPAEITIVIFAAVAISAGLDRISSARSGPSPQ